MMMTRFSVLMDLSVLLVLLWYKSSVATHMAHMYRSCMAPGGNSAPCLILFLNTGRSQVKSERAVIAGSIEVLIAAQTEALRRYQTGRDSREGYIYKIPKPRRLLNAIFLLSGNFRFHMNVIGSKASRRSIAAL